MSGCHSLLPQRVGWPTLNVTAGAAAWLAACNLARLTTRSSWLWASPCPLRVTESRLSPPPPPNSATGTPKGVDAYVPLLFTILNEGVSPLLPANLKAAGLSINATFTPTWGESNLKHVVNGELVVDGLYMWVRVGVGHREGAWSLIRAACQCWTPSAAVCLLACLPAVEGQQPPADSPLPPQNRLPLLQPSWAGSKAGLHRALCDGWHGKRG